MFTFYEHKFLMGSNLWIVLAVSGMFCTLSRYSDTVSDNNLLSTQGESKYSCGASVDS